MCTDVRRKNSNAASWLIGIFIAATHLAPFFRRKSYFEARKLYLSVIPGNISIFFSLSNLDYTSSYVNSARKIVNSFKYRYLPFTLQQLQSGFAIPIINLPKRKARSNIHLECSIRVN